MRIEMLDRHLQAGGRRARCRLFGHHPQEVRQRKAGRRPVTYRCCRHRVTVSVDTIDSRLDGLDCPIDPRLTDRARRAELLGPQTDPQLLNLPPDLGDIS